MKTSSLQLKHAKVIIIGDQSVGKSAIMHCFSKKEAPTMYKTQPTIGAEFFNRIIKIADGETINL